MKSKRPSSACTLHPDKSPGPDGYNPGFFQKFWIIGANLVSLTQQFFVRGKLDHCIGDANIVLIPKKKNAVTMMNLCPISLCNAVYKVISKVIPNRLMTALNLLISEN